MIREVRQLAPSQAVRKQRNLDICACLWTQNLTFNNYSYLLTIHSKLKLVQKSLDSKITQLNK